MAEPLANVTTRIAYGASQLPRIAWYLGHGMVLRQLAAAMRSRSAAGESRARAPIGSGRRPLDDRRIYADMAALFREDLRNVEKGIYPLPAEHDGAMSTLLARSLLFFSDLPAIHRRRAANRWREVQSEAIRGKRPDYYLQNFHFQSGGWLTEDSAQRYDTQVEVLFKGTANAIRRQALPPLAQRFAGRDQRRLRFADVGCGTGRFLDFFKQAWPRLPAIGLDLSEAYLAEARRHLRRAGWINFIVGKAEALPFADNSQDALSSIFLMHELPPAVRRDFFRESARVLKRGGRMVIINSLQLGDEPDYDGALEVFPRSYHEPYYASYLREDFGALATQSGLSSVPARRAYISKVMVFDKP